MKNLLLKGKAEYPKISFSDGRIDGTTTIHTNNISSYNSQTPDISYTDNWYKNETRHFVQKTFRAKFELK